MNKLVVLSLGNGDLGNGFGAVTAQLWEQSNPYPMKFTARLPAAPEIPELYRYWHLLYEALYQRLDLCPRIEIDASDVTNVSSVEFSDLCQRLQNSINAWLNSEPFRNIDQQLRTQLDASEEIRFIIETNDNLLRRIPWHLWNFFEDYPKYLSRFPCEARSDRFSIPTERLGFSDFVVDPDGILRRHLLALTPDPASPCTTSYALVSSWHFVT